MSDIFVENDVKQWRPPLIELTQIGHPDIAGGVPQALYIDPTFIVFATPSFSGWSEKATTGEAKRVECTAIFLSTGQTVSVMETPAQINARRNAAMGIEVKPKLNLEPKMPENVTRKDWEV